MTLMTRTPGLRAFSTLAFLLPAFLASAASAQDASSAPSATPAKPEKPAAADPDTAARADDAPSAAPPATPGVPTEEPPLDEKPADVPEAAMPRAPQAPPAAGEPDPTMDDAANRRAPKNKGVIWGLVKSSGGDSLIEAQVSVVGQQKRALTDVDGWFRLELPPGTYSLRVFYELHKARRIENVKVAVGQLQRVDVTLEADRKAEEIVTAIEADVLRATTNAQLTLRKKSANVTDGVGSQEIAKTPDRNAADAVRRVVGATIVDNKFVYVRGLGERYTNALLNGSPLPSSEPDRAAVPLDIFPVAVLSDVGVTKTFTPDMPGDFVGGSVSVHTRDFPTKFTFTGTLSTGFNSEATFQERLAPPESGKYDALAIESGLRSLPSGFPAPKQSVLLEDPAYRMALNTAVAPKKVTSPPNFGGSLVLGDTVQLGGPSGQSVSYQAALSYGRTFTRRFDELLRTFGPQKDPTNPKTYSVFNELRGESGNVRTLWSAFGSAGWGVSDQKIALTALYSRSGDLESRQFTGVTDELPENIVEDTRIRAVNRGLFFGQLRGEHKLPALASTLEKMEIDWVGTYSRATLDDPDFRGNVFIIDPATIDTQTGAPLRSFDVRPFSGLHFFGKQGETGTGAMLNLKQATRVANLDGLGRSFASLKVGGFFQGRDRNFDARRFNLEPSSSGFGTPACTPDPTRQALANAFSDSYVQNCYQLRENTQGTDSYTAASKITAAYAMAELVGFDERLRIVGGPRFEHWTQTLTTAGRTYDFDTPDVLPGGSIIYRLIEDMNLRLAGSQTVARPQLRELAPFLFSDYFGARDNQGNPNLQRTLVTNLDARWEWFPSQGEVLAVSGFYKYFKRPIEPIIYQQGSSTLNYFSNAPNAQNLGVEFEARKNLAFLGSDVPVVQDLSLVANVTLVKSKVEIPGDPTIRSVLTTQDARALTFQAPYIVNTALDWTPKGGKARLRAMYNVFGPRLVLVGIQGVPDLYEMPRHVVDVTGSYKFDGGFELRVTAENILNAPWRFQHGVKNDDALAQRYLTGTNLNVFLTYVND
jgi:hypothetical protein